MIRHIILHILFCWLYHESKELTPLARYNVDFPALRATKYNTYLPHFAPRSDTTMPLHGKRLQPHYIKNYLQSLTSWAVSRHCFSTFWGNTSGKGGCRPHPDNTTPNSTIPKNPPHRLLIWQTFAGRRDTFCVHCPGRSPHKKYGI